MNLRFGNKLFGRYIWAASVKKQSGPGPGPDPSEVKYIPDYVQVIFYNKDGTKTAIFQGILKIIRLIKSSLKILKQAAAAQRSISNSFQVLQK